MSEADAFRRRMARYMRDAERRYLAAGRGELAADVAQLAARLAAPAEPPGLPGSGTAQGVDNDAGAASVAGGAGEAVTGASPSPAYCSHYACRCARAAELAALADRPMAAAQAYGYETGTCCVCGRDLTNKESVETGIGPVCAGRMGWTPGGLVRKAADGDF